MPLVAVHRILQARLAYETYFHKLSPGSWSIPPFDECINSARYYGDRVSLSTKDNKFCEMLLSPHGEALFKVWAIRTHEATVQY